jgi:hypothetical protein
VVAVCPAGCHAWVDAGEPARSGVPASQAAAATRTKMTRPTRPIRERTMPLLAGRARIGAGWRRQGRSPPCQHVGDGRGPGSCVLVGADVQHGREGHEQRDRSVQRPYDSPPEQARRDRARPRAVRRVARAPRRLAARPNGPSSACNGDAGRPGHRGAGGAWPQREGASDDPYARRHHRSRAGRAGRGRPESRAPMPGWSASRQRPTGHRRPDQHHPPSPPTCCRCCAPNSNAIPLTQLHARLVRNQLTNVPHAAASGWTLPPSPVSWSHGGAWAIAGRLVAGISRLAGTGQGG